MDRTDADQRSASVGDRLDGPEVGRRPDVDTGLLFLRRDVDLFVAALKVITLLPSYACATSDGEPDFARAAATIAELRDVLPAVVTYQLPLAVVAKAFRIAADKSTAR